MFRTVLFAICFFVSISIVSQQKEFSSFIKNTSIGGRIMYDYEFLSAGDYSLNGSEFRRVRLHAKGSISKSIKYKMDFDFAKGTPSFRAIYIQIKLPKKTGSLKIGNFTEPTGLNNMISSNYITFFERAMLANTNPSKYNTGALFEKYRLFDTNFNLEFAYTNNGDKNGAFKGSDIENGVNFITRITTSVFEKSEKKQLVHLGFNYEYRSNNSSGYKYKIRPENHLGDSFTIDSDDSYKNTANIGFEIAAKFNSLCFQAEYEESKINSKIKTYKTNSYYAFVSYFITGENRTYKNGTFKRIKLKKNIENGIGAIEIAMRYSGINFSGYTLGKQKINNLSFGLNWYFTKQARFMYNYVYTNKLDLYNHNLAGHLIRFQVDF